MKKLKFLWTAVAKRHVASKQIEDGSGDTGFESRSQLPACPCLGNDQFAGRTGFDFAVQTAEVTGRRIEPQRDLQ